MKKIKSELIVLFYFILLANSCISQTDKNKSDNYIKLSENIIKENISCINTDSCKKAFQKALAYLNIAIKLDSLNKNAYLNKITILKELGKDTDVINTLSKLLTIDSLYVEGYTVIGIYYEKQQKFDSAKLSYGRAKSIYLKKPATDLRNGNLIFVEYLITNNKDEAFKKLNHFTIQNLELVNNIKEEIIEIEKERLKLPLIGPSLLF